MKILTGMSPADHKKTGYELWTFREQLTCLITSQFQYIRNCRPRNRAYKKGDQAIKSTDAIREFLEECAYHDLEGKFPYAFYHPGTQGEKFSPLLIGCRPTDAKRFLQNAKLREEGLLDGMTTTPFDGWEVRVMMTFCLFGARDVFTPITSLTNGWTDKSKTAKLQGLIGQAEAALYDLSISLTLFSRGWK